MRLCKLKRYPFDTSQKIGAFAHSHRTESHTVSLVASRVLLVVSHRGMINRPTFEERTAELFNERPRR